jgi:hypothetical protein
MTRGAPCQPACVCACVHARRNWINPWSTRVHVPRFSELVSALSYVNNNRNIRNFLASNLIDLYVRPELREVKLLDYHKMVRLTPSSPRALPADDTVTPGWPPDDAQDDIVAIGYRCAVARITEWRLGGGDTVLRGNMKRLARSSSLTALAPTQARAQTPTMHFRADARTLCCAAGKGPPAASHSQRAQGDVN